MLSSTFSLRSNYIKTMKKIILLGATGSIGKQSLEIIQKNQEQLVGFSFHQNIDQARKIIKEFNPEIVCCGNEEQANKLSLLDSKIVFVYGEDGLSTLASYIGDLTLINALVGSVGIRPTIEAIKTQKRICLANKETLVVAGDFIMPLVKEYGVEILPIDSEHVALHQLLTLCPSSKEVYLTASGGALRDWPLSELVKATKEDVLLHPTWSMGDKITVDSATMMNKGFEVMEAMHLFGLKPAEVKTILHRESVVHAMIKHPTGAILQHIAPNDMKYSIEYALYFPRQEFDYETSLSHYSNLHFEELSYKSYPLLELAYEVANKRGILPCVLNASNEAAVELFLTGKISFDQIQSIIINTLSTYKNSIPVSVDQLIEIGKEVHNRIKKDYP
jgi:1-deoxy-D-xylulose-5-phosphate reductoisomerase